MPSPGGRGSTVPPLGGGGSDQVRGGTGRPMNPLKRSILGGVSLMIRGANRLLLDVRVSGRSRVPPGAKIYASNHISSLDGFHVMPYLRGPLHYVLGPGYQQGCAARMLDGLEQIDAMSQDQDAIVRRAAEYLGRGESIVIAPEGDIQPPFRLGRFYPGVAQIYRESGAPIVPMALVAPAASLREWPRFNTTIDGRLYRMVVVRRGPYCLRFGEPWRPEIDGASSARWAVRVARELRDRVAALIEEVRLSEGLVGDPPAPPQTSAPSRGTECPK